jgi:hypothetical protein
LAAIDDLCALCALSLSKGTMLAATSAVLSSSNGSAAHNLR